MSSRKLNINFITRILMVLCSLFLLFAFETHSAELNNNNTKNEKLLLESVINESDSFKQITTYYYDKSGMNIKVELLTLSPHMKQICTTINEFNEIKKISIERMTCSQNEKVISNVYTENKYDVDGRLASKEMTSNNGGFESKNIITFSTQWENRPEKMQIINKLSEITMLFEIDNCGNNIKTTSTMTTEESNQVTIIEEKNNYGDDCLLKSSIKSSNGQIQSKSEYEYNELGKTSKLTMTTYGPNNTSMTSFVNTEYNELGMIEKTISGSTQGGNTTTTYKYKKL